MDGLRAIILDVPILIVGKLLNAMWVSVCTLIGRLAVHVSCDIVGFFDPESVVPPRTLDCVAWAFTCASPYTVAMQLPTVPSRAAIAAETTVCIWPI